jgi:putative transposase
MTRCSPLRDARASPEVLRLTVMLYVRFPLSLRNVEDPLHERGLKLNNETVRFWRQRFGPMFWAEIRKRRANWLKTSHSRWHLAEMFVRINGVQDYL